MKNSFGASPINIFGHPYFLARSDLRLIFSELIQSFPPRVILDVGCGSTPYRPLFPPSSIYHGLEIDQQRNHGNPNVTFWYDGNAFPVPDYSYDAILCSQVLEHSFKPELLLAEAYRVLESRGRLLLSVPFFWPEHEQPFDSQRFTSFGLIDRLQSAGFTDITVHKTNPGLACLIQLAIEWLESIGRKLDSRLARAWPILMFIPYTFFNFLGLAYRNLPVIRRTKAQAEFFLDLVICARRP